MNKKVALSVLSATVFASMAASAFAAPKSGLYIGGNVDKYYSMNTLLGGMSSSALDQFSTEIGSAGFGNLIYVDFDGKGASIAEIMSATDFESAKKDLTADKFEGVYSNIKADGSADGTYDPRNDAIDTPTGDLTVESVSAINLNTVEIVFGTAVDKADAENEANYTVGASTLAAYDSNAVATLSADKKTVTIVFDAAAPFANNAWETIGVPASMINKDGSTTEYIEAYSTAVQFKDSVAPTVKSSNYSPATATLPFTVNFSEAVDFTNATVKVYDADNAEVADYATNAASFSQNASKTNLVLNTSATGVNLPDNATYKMVVMGATDLNGNTFANNRLEVSFKKEKTDAVKPQFASVTVVDNKTVRVTFNEPVVIGATGKVADLVLDGAGAVDLKVVTGTPALVGEATEVTAGKVFDVKVANAARATNGLASGVHSIALSNFADLSGNAEASSVSKVFQAPADAAAPTVSKTEVKRNASNNGYLVTFTFNEVVRKDATTAATLLTPDNVSLTLASAQIADGTGDKEITVDVLDSLIGTAQAGNYQLTIPSGVVEDVYDNSAALNLPVTLTNASDPAQPGVATVTVQGAAGNDTVVVQYDKTMGASAAVATNYLLDGQSVFQSAVFTDTAKTTVKLTLKPDVLDLSAFRTLKMVNVKDAKGNDLKAADATRPAASYNENVAPTITKAEIVDATHIKLTFSEALLSSTATTGVVNEDDFVVTIDGTVATQTAATSTITDVVSDTTVTLVLSGAGITDLTKPVVVKAATGNDAVDTNGNAIKTTTVTAQ
ncbi:hypothetical protein [Brevibacillus centrosporus]|uniref:hypothetical protein n=1 Tax=Brevibacillus centrosporus TaxID=54910 RepID=UPI003806DDBE